MNPPLLDVEHLSKRFDNGVLAVDDVSLRVWPGETLGIVGESGCGKSTTAKLILRLLKADAGTVAFGGYNLLALGPRALAAMRADIQLVPQNPQMSINPRMTVSQALFPLGGAGRRFGGHRAVPDADVDPAADVRAAVRCRPGRIGL